MRQNSAYKEGYEMGFDDAMMGRPMKKNRLSLLTRFVIGGEKYQAVFLQAYNKGYTEGLRKLKTQG